MKQHDIKSTYRFPGVQHSHANFDKCDGGRTLTLCLLPLPLWKKVLRKDVQKRRSDHPAIFRMGKYLQIGQIPQSKDSKDWTFVTSNVQQLFLASSDLVSCLMIFWLAYLCAPSKVSIFHMIIEESG